MSDPDRIFAPIEQFPTRDQGKKDCAVSTTCAIHTITTTSGKAYAAIVFNQEHCPIGYASVMDRTEAEAHIALLQNALDDADRINGGKAPLAQIYNPDRKLN